MMNFLAASLGLQLIFSDDFGANDIK